MFCDSAPLIFVSFCQSNLDWTAEQPHLSLEPVKKWYKGDVQGIDNCAIFLFLMYCSVLATQRPLATSLIDDWAGHTQSLLPNYSHTGKLFNKYFCCLSNAKYPQSHVIWPDPRSGGDSAVLNWWGNERCMRDERGEDESRAEISATLGCQQAAGETPGLTWWPVTRPLIRLEPTRQVLLRYQIFINQDFFLSQPRCSHSATF